MASGHIREKTFIELPGFDPIEEGEPSELPSTVFDKIATRVMIGLLAQLTVPDERRLFLAAIIRTAARIQNEDADRKVTYIIETPVDKQCN